MAEGTGIYTPPSMLGDNVPDGTKFLRDDNKWVNVEVEFSPADFLDLLVYAFQRIEFLEKAAGIEYGKRGLQPPEQYNLIQERVSWK